MIRNFKRRRKSRTFVAILIAVLVALALSSPRTLVYIWSVISGQLATWPGDPPANGNPTPSLPGLIYGVSGNLPDYYLYPAQLMPVSGQNAAAPVRRFDVKTPAGVREASFIANADQTTKAIFYQSDGDKLSFSKDYFAPLANEAGWHQRSLIIYEANGADVHSEEWYRLNGSKEKIGHRLQDGGYLAFTLFDDGQTAASETLTGPPDPSANNYEPKVLLEQSWYERKHVLAERNQLADDGTREDDTFDAEGLPVMQKHIGLHGVAGTTIKVFHPGSEKVLLESKTSSRSTDASFSRPDGSLQLVQILTPYGIGVTYFDDQGKVPLFKQSWFLMTEKKDGRPVLHIWKIAELEANGETKRELTFNNGKLETEVWLNVTIDGIVWARMTVYYNEDGTALATELTPAGKGETKTITTPPAIAGIGVVPARELVEPDLHYNLPIPPEPRPDRDDH